MSRIFLFLATNFAVIIVLSAIMNLLGLNQQNSSMLPTIIFAAAFGMGGSFISLWMSKGMALRSTGAQIIDAPKNATESWLLGTVKRQVEKAEIGMSDVAIFDSPALKAFATGAKRDDALVAVSSGFLNGMKERGIEAVSGHEISRVANGDMVTLTLIQL